MVIFDGEQPFESFYLKHFDTLQDLQNCTECFKNLSIYSSSIYYQTSQSNTGSFKRILTENDEWLDVTFWKNGGNYFTSSFKLGTLNSNELNFITSGSKRLTISPFGNIQISKSVNIDENLTISGSTTILSTLYDSLLEAGSTNQFLKSNNISGSQWTTIQMSHVSGLLNYTSSISSSFVDINNSLNSYTSSNNTSINNLNQVSASFKTFTSSLNIWTGSFSSSVNTQFSNINTSLTGLNTFSSSINSLTSSYFIQGGNSFGTSAILGTNDNQPLNLETSGSIRINISTLGDVVVFKGFEVKQNLLVRGSTFLYSALYDSNISAGSSTQFLRSVSTNGTVWTDIQMSHVSGLLNYTSSISSSLNSLNSYTSSNNTVLNNFSVYTSSLNVATGSFFKQGGNSFGTSGSIGTLDNNNFNIITSGSTRIFVSSSGAIGIGAIAPNAPLQFSNTISDRKITLYESGNNIHQVIGIGLSSSGHFKFQVSTTLLDYIFNSATSSTMSNELMRIKGTGNILIGTSTDSGYKLDVNGTTNSTFFLTPNYFQSTGTTPLLFSFNGNQDIWSQGATSTIRFIDSGYANVNFSINQSGSGYFRGNVGIGMSPFYKLDVSGDLNISQSAVYRIAGNPIFQRNTSFWNYIYDFSNSIALQLGGTSDAVNYYNNTQHVFKSRNQTSEYARFHSTGNFSINSSTDSGYKLDVNGTLRNTTSAYFSTTSGNVGIGTVTANQKLEVSSAGATSIRINNTLSNTWDITNSAPSGELHFTRGGSNTHIRIDNVGNMGLGISPITKLHISGSQINESPSGVNLTLYNSSDSNRNGYISVTGDGDFSNRFVNIGSNSTAYGFKILNAATEFIRILNNGNIGIGTTSPTSQMHIKSVNPVFRLEGSTTSGYVDFNDTRMNIHAGTGYMSLVAGTVERMRIAADGNVGIGTTTPNAQLHLTNTTVNRKIVLYEGTNNDHQFYGFGVNSGVFRYQVNGVNDNHVFYAGTGTTTSQQLLSINGDQTITYTPLTTSQINALTKVNGKNAYNSDTDKPVWCDGTTWKYADGTNM